MYLKHIVARLVSVIPLFHLSGHCAKQSPSLASAKSVIYSTSRDCGKMSTNHLVPSNLKPHVLYGRLFGIDGDNDKKNDLIFKGNAKCKTQDHASHVIFFGGDVQDFIENMESHRDNKRYVQWNLETTAEIIREKFPESHVWVIKPVRMHLKTFSVFSNFVESDDMGCPNHSLGQRSWNHLAKLLQNAAQKFADDEILPQDTFKSASIKIVGFSKGSVVLNQLLYDLEATKSDEEVESFVKMVDAMYWLDGGHAGGSNTWVNDDEVLDSLTDTRIKIHCHVTPYQVADSNRKWIAKEHKRFVAKLQQRGHEVINQLHFEDKDRSIDNHFGVLVKF